MSFSFRLLAVTCIHLLTLQGIAREWHSADGKHTLVGTFSALQNDRLSLIKEDGKPTTVQLGVLSQEDQQFARAAHAVATDALKLGPQTYEVGRPVEGGWICKFGKEMSMQKGKFLFTGEQFFLASADGNLSMGQQIHDQVLFAIGMRTFVPLEGDHYPIKAFHPLIEEATNSQLLIAMKPQDPNELPPAVYEPLVEPVTTLGLGLIVSDKGHLVVDASLIKDSKDIVIDAGQDHVKGSVIAVEEKLGIALIKGDAQLGAGRFGGKKPLTLGQSLYALSIPLNATSKGLSSPVITKGIVSRMIESGNSKGTFEHDAMLAEDVLGGFLVTEKGEMGGVFFIPKRKTSSRSKSNSTSEADQPASLRSAITVHTLNAWLEQQPGVGGLKSGGGGDLAELSSALRKAVTIVTSLQEVEVERPKIDLRRTVATSTSQPTVGPDGAPLPAGWSLSKSGTRHNAKCQYYNAKYPCQATDGKPCKVCGG